MPRPKLFAELGQCVSRRPWGHTLPCFSTKAKVYSYFHGALLSAGVQSRLMGFLEIEPMAMGEQPLRTLVGNGVCLGHMTIAVACIYVNAEAPHLQLLGDAALPHIATTPLEKAAERQRR